MDKIEFIEPDNRYFIEIINWSSISFNPFVPVNVTYDNFIKHCKRLAKSRSNTDVTEIQHEILATYSAKLSVFRFIFATHDDLVRLKLTYG